MPLLLAQTLFLLLLLFLEFFLPLLELEVRFCQRITFQGWKLERTRSQPGWSARRPRQRRFARVAKRIVELLRPRPPAILDGAKPFAPARPKLR